MYFGGVMFFTEEDAGSIGLGGFIFILHQGDAGDSERGLLATEMRKDWFDPHPVHCRKKQKSHCEEKKEMALY